MTDPQELFDQAIALHQAGALDQAEALYQRMLLLLPASVAPRHMLGVIRYQQGRYADAIELITQALKRNPNVAAPCWRIWAGLRRRWKAWTAPWRWSRTWWPP